MRWNKVEDKLPPVGDVVLVASPAFGCSGWRVRSACLFIRHDGVFPTPDRVPSGPTDFWFDAPRGDNDMRLVRPGMMWAETPTPDNQINWRDDPDAIVEDDEPMVGRDYA